MLSIGNRTHKNMERYTIVPAIERRHDRVDTNSYARLIHSGFCKQPSFNHRDKIWAVFAFDLKHNHTSPHYEPIQFCRHKRTTSNGYDRSSAEIEHSAPTQGATAAARCTAERHITSVRQFIVSTSSNESPDPSAIPSSSAKSSGKYCSIVAPNPRAKATASPQVTPCARERTLVPASGAEDLARGAVSPYCRGDPGKQSTSPGTLGKDYSYTVAPPRLRANGPCSWAYAAFPACAIHARLEGRPVRNGCKVSMACPPRSAMPSIGQPYIKYFRAVNEGFLPGVIGKPKVRCVISIQDTPLRASEEAAVATGAREDNDVTQQHSAVAASTADHAEYTQTLRWWDGFTISLSIPAALFIGMGYALGALGGWTTLALLATVATLPPAKLYLLRLAGMFPRGRRPASAAYANEAGAHAQKSRPLAAFGYWFAGEFTCDLRNPNRLPGTGPMPVLSDAGHIQQSAVARDDGFAGGEPWIAWIVRYLPVSFNGVEAVPRSHPEVTSGLIDTRKHCECGRFVLFCIRSWCLRSRGLAIERDV
ncbi:hypothetical protein FQR65_LT20504 [Abscondita terminalis]|nr:hypothetical protein FQR65_LT20504 [Abscondita terminalis]